MLYASCIKKLYSFKKLETYCSRKCCKLRLKFCLISIEFRKIFLNILISSYIIYVCDKFIVQNNVKTYAEKE